jgi:hypothetical protein
VLPRRDTLPYKGTIFGNRGVRWQGSLARAWSLILGHLQLHPGPGLRKEASLAGSGGNSESFWQDRHVPLSLGMNASVYLELSPEAMLK